MKRTSLFFSVILILFLLFIPAFTSVDSIPGESISMIDISIESEVLIEASDTYVMNSEKNFNFDSVFIIDISERQDVIYVENIYIEEEDGNIRMESDFNIRFS